MKIPKEIIESWRQRCYDFLIKCGFKIEDVKTWIDAWTVVHASKILHDGIYRERQDILDSHVETAMKHIFPNLPKR